jgi:1-phosphatidylinositol-4-phosphate 5-kinase
MTNTFAEGLSNDKKLLSPINPEPYGERFIKFIEGITKSPEEATREKEEAEAVAATTNVNSSRRRSNSLGMALGIHRTPTSNSAIQRATEEAGKKPEKEKERPDPRTIGVVRSPSAERTGGLQGQILPVVDEGGEGSSTGEGGGGRSIRSFHSALETGADGQEKRPRTPAKDVDRSRLSAEDASERRPRTPVKDAHWVTNGSLRGSSPNGVRTKLSRSSLDKDLPPLPKPDEKVGGGYMGKEKVVS